MLIKLKGKKNHILWHRGIRDRMLQAYKKSKFVLENYIIADDGIEKKTACANREWTIGLTSFQDIF